MVVSQAGTRRDEAADDDVFLQATQVVSLAHDGGFGQDTSRFLERSGRDERVGRQRGLRDTQQHVVVGRRDTFFGSHTIVGVQQFRALDLLARDELGIASVDDVHTTQHLTNNHFDVLVVDLHALQTVHVLHFVDDVGRQLLDALQTQDVVGIGRAESGTSRSRHPGRGLPDAA
ncbi:hypothetical protein G6F57_020061 [Rhizopus arrhizus]|nr:hypothetical protein G6F57_020061 [Rhizopus arrhizus]